MIEWLKKANERRLQAEDRRARADGFEWAMRAYYMDRWTARRIEDQVDCGAHFGASAFDQGAEDALTLIRSAECPGSSLIGRTGWHRDQAQGQDANMTAWLVLEIGAVILTVGVAALLYWWFGR